MMLRITLILILTTLPLSSLSLDLNKACEEETEQRKSLMKKLSTSLSEANLAGQCKGFHGNNLSIYAACEEYIEQENNLLGNLSTSFSESHKAGICMGAIYAACDNNNFTSIAERIVDRNDKLIRKFEIKNTVGCNG